MIHRPHPVRERHPLLTLPKDEEVRKALQEKLVKYRTRLQGYGRYGSTDAEAAEIIADARFKIAIIEALFAKGSVNAPHLFLELITADRRASGDRFRRAFLTIQAYVTGNAGKVTGGDGFGQR